MKTTLWLTRVRGSQGPTSSRGTCQLEVRLAEGAALVPTRCMSSGKQKGSSHHAPRMSETIIMISPNWEAAWVQQNCDCYLNSARWKSLTRCGHGKKNQLLVGVTCCKPATVSLVGLRDFRPELKYGHHIPNLETTEFNQSTQMGVGK